MADEDRGAEAVGDRDEDRERVAVADEARAAEAADVGNKAAGDKDEDRERVGEVEATGEAVADQEPRQPTAATNADAAGGAVEEAATAPTSSAPRSVSSCASGS